MTGHKTTTILLDGKRVKLQLWDTSGQGRFCTIIRSYSRGAQGILLVYDITNKWSFEGLDRWMKEIQEVQRVSSLWIAVLFCIDYCNSGGKGSTQHLKSKLIRKDYRKEIIKFWYQRFHSPSNVGGCNTSDQYNIIVSVTVTSPHQWQYLATVISVTVLVCFIVVVASSYNIIRVMFWIFDVVLTLSL